MSDKSISDIISERDALAVKVARVEALCERWRAKRSTASAGAALRLVLGDPGGRTMSGGVEIRFTLTQRQADAVLRSKGLSQGYGVRLSVALREADMRLRHAVINALAGHPDGAEQAGERQRTGQTRAGGKG